MDHLRLFLVLLVSYGMHMHYDLRSHYMQTGCRLPFSDLDVVASSVKVNVKLLHGAFWVMKLSMVNPNLNHNRSLTKDLDKLIQENSFV